MAIRAGLITRTHSSPLRRHLVPSPASRAKTTSAQRVATRAIDPVFEKLMDGYKHLFKVLSVLDLVLASPDRSLPLPLLSAAAQRLHLNRGAAAFVRKFPRVFSLVYDPAAARPLVRLTPAAVSIAHAESSSCSHCPAAARLSRLLAMSLSRSLPLRAVFKVLRELGLPDDFEDSVVARNPTLFSLHDNPKEPNTHILELAHASAHTNLVPAVEAWRAQERAKDTKKADEMELKFGFKQGFPPGMRLSKNFKQKLKDWQRLAYDGPYEKPRRGERRAAEKRAVGIVHEFLSLTVEGMVEVEKISHFRKWLGIELNIRSLFLDHPGMFYLSTKGKRHTVFLREMYERGRLVEPNPVYEERQRMLELVLMRRRGIVGTDVAEATRLSEEEEECDADGG